MKKKILLIKALFFISFLAYAQTPSKRQLRSEKIKALKIAFITEKLDLTPKQAEKFWPIYNKFDKVLHQLERVEKFKIKKKIKEAGGIDIITEKEAKSLISKLVFLEVKTHTAKITFDKNLAKVLSYKQILKLKITEREFVRTLMRKYRRKKGVRKK